MNKIIFVLISVICFLTSSVIYGKEGIIERCYSVYIAILVQATHPSEQIAVSKLLADVHGIPDKNKFVKSEDYFYAIGEFAGSNLLECLGIKSPDLQREVEKYLGLKKNSTSSSSPSFMTCP